MSTDPKLATAIHELAYEVRRLREEMKAGLERHFPVRPKPSDFRAIPHTANKSSKKCSFKRKR